MKTANIPLGEKEYLNPGEAANYWNLSRRKLFRFLDEGKHEFLALYGNRKLIIRIAFDKYLKDNPSVKEELANGKPRGYKTRLEASSAK